MPEFSSTSRGQLMTCHDDLIRLFVEVVKEFDCKIIIGHRIKWEQDEAFKDKMSKVKWPNSLHNKYPSRAVDVIPYPVDWKDEDRNHMFGGYVLGVAKQLRIRVRWGHDWNKNKKLDDQKFIDSPHYELY